MLDVTSATEYLSSVQTTPIQTRRRNNTTDLTRRAQRIAVLGDSTAVGLGDPLPNGSWRGFGPLLGDAMDVSPNAVLNTAVTGARMKDVRTRQLPAALRHKPDVAIVVVGMNDTLRSDFDAVDIGRDLDAVLTAFGRIGTHVVCVRYHDHARIFWLPKVLATALTDRINDLNEVIDACVVGRAGVGCVDANADPLTYEMAAWSVDRLHPSELGHRMLAQKFGALLVEAGFSVPYPVSLECSGGREVSRTEHVGWLVLAGIPWLVRRGKDFVPYGLAIAGRAMAASAQEKFERLRLSAGASGHKWRVGAARAIANVV